MLGYRITLSMMAMSRHGSHELIRPGLVVIEVTCGENRVWVF